MSEPAVVVVDEPHPVSRFSQAQIITDEQADPALIEFEDLKKWLQVFRTHPVQGQRDAYAKVYNQVVVKPARALGRYTPGHDLLGMMLDWPRQF